MTLVATELSAMSYEQVRAYANEMEVQARDVAKRENRTLCTCDVEMQARIAGLPVEQLKGLAIGAHLAIRELLPSVILTDWDSPVHAALHNLMHLQLAAVRLAGSDDLIEQDEIPL